MSGDHQECRICGHAGAHPTFVAREMMFGTREEFAYFECRQCGCVQIAQLPADLTQYYPPSYYSLTVPQSKRNSPFKAFLLRQRFRNALVGRGHKVNRLLSMFVKMPPLRVDYVLPIVQVLEVARISSFSARFLDVGCGQWSRWLSNLAKVGFRRLFGVDPFIREDLRHGCIRIVKRPIQEMRGQFDLITFHHSLEHIPEQTATLAAAASLLAPNGVILVRIPVVSSYAWRHYRTNWVEMDPPRHLYLHSRQSIRLAGERAGLRLYQTLCDSFEFEFYGSEQYLRGIPLVAETSLWHNPHCTTFTPIEIEHFKTMARQVNEQNDCGRACFFFDAKSAVQ